MTEQMILDRMAQMIRVGFVNARQPEKMRVKVTIKDTTSAELVTDWLPVLCPRASQDMQYDLPDIGDQVLCLFLSYGLEQGFVVGAMYGKQTPPVQSGDKWHRTFSDGAYLEYDRAKHALKAEIPGTALIKCASSITLQAPIIYARGTFVNTAEDGSPGKSSFSGGMEVLNGGINVPGADVVASGVSLTSHTTDGVQAGNDTSSHPTGGSSESPGTGTIIANALMGLHAAILTGLLLGILDEDVNERGEETDETIWCLPEIAAAMAQRAREEGREDDAIGLEYLKTFFENWFRNGPTPTAQNSEEYIKFLKLNPPCLVDLEWVLRYPRAKEIYDKWISLDEKPGTILSPAGQNMLGKRLCEHGILNPDKEEVDFDFTQLPYTDYEDYYFNFVVIPDLKPNEIDDKQLEGLFAALGAFTIAALAKGTAKNMGNGNWEIHVKNVCVYVRDRFNFETEKLEDKVFESFVYTLGYWSCDEMDFSKGRRNSTYIGLRNKDFRNFRDKYARGGDFFVLSKPVCIDNTAVKYYEYTCEKK